MQVELVREKETKGTFRYAEESEHPLIGMVYIPKSTLDQLGNPERLKVTLEAAEQHLAAVG
jgi:hypothetical protein